MSDIAYDTINECIPDLTEDEALSIIQLLSSRFGFAGYMFTRSDAEREWQAIVPRSPGEGLAEMPDTVWNKVRSHPDWHKGLPHFLNAEGWDIVRDVVSTVVDG